MTKEKIISTLKNGYFWLSLVVTLALLCIPAFLYPYSYCRLYASAMVFADRFYCIGMKLSSGEYIPFTISSFLNWGTASGSQYLGFDLSTYWLIQNQGIEWSLWLSNVFDFFMGLFRTLMIVFIFWIIGRSFLNHQCTESGLTYRDSSKSGSFLEKLYLNKLPLVKAWFVNWWAYFKDSAFYTISLVFFLFGFNLISYVLDLVGFYFYFFFTFDFKGFGDLVGSLVVSIVDSLKWLPVWVWFIVAYVVFCFVRSSIAHKKLEKLQSIDKEVSASDTGVLSLFLGKMRGGKTTLATSFARFDEINFRDNALDNITRLNSYFPSFPWALFEKDLLGNMIGKKRTLHNIEEASILAYSLYPHIKKRYGYDIKESPLFYYDGSISLSLKDGMAIYAESYFIYAMPSSLMVTNLPIRDDCIWIYNGHFVVWDSDSLNHDNKNMWAYSTFSHVINYDMLRFGKKVNPNSIWKDSAGAGVYVSTEFGKEYGNQLTNTNVKISDPESNSKNDLLDLTIKLGGHLANVWHDNFFKMVADEQRSGSLASNLVDVAQSVFVADPHETKQGLAIPFYWVEPAIHDFIISRCDGWLLKYRVAREDKTFSFCLINLIRSIAFRRETAIFNRFGYKEMASPLNSADVSGKMQATEKVKYYILNYVDYADRFESACMKDFLNHNKKNSQYGVFDLPVYKNLMPTTDEWDFQKAHLVETLENPENCSRLRSRGDSSFAGVGMYMPTGKDCPMDSDKGGSL